MSYLAETLDDILKERNLTQAELARMTKIDEAKISRWRLRRTAAIKKPDLVRLLNAFHHKGDKARLIVALLKDICPPEGAELVNIEPRDSDVVVRGRQSEMPPMPAKVRRAFEVLMKNADDPDLRDLILSLANLKEKGTFNPNA